MCDSGTNPSCPIHARNDYFRLEEESGFVKIITYAGEYAVYTKNNNVTGDQYIDSMMMYGQPPAAYVTTVFKVGTQGVMWDIFGGYDDETPESFEKAKAHTESLITFREGHSDWGNVDEAHDMVVEGCQNGILMMDNDGGKF